jgi:hypothetical protein
VTPDEQRELLRLAWHWSDWYDLSVVDDGTFLARPAGAPADILTASSAEELRELLRIDHAERQSARKAAGHLSERMST